MLQSHVGRLGLESGPFVILLQRHAFEKKRVTFQVDMDLCQFPNQWADLLLFERKGAALLQSSQQSTAEGNVVDQVPFYLTNPLLLIIDYQVARHSAEHSGLPCRRMKVWRRLEVQRGRSRGRSCLCPHKRHGQKL